MKKWLTLLLILPLLTSAQKWQSNAIGWNWIYSNGAYADSADVRSWIAASTSSVTKSSIGLGNVENTALSTWAGTANITTLGTIGTGTWHGTAIGDTWISSAASWNAKQATITTGTTAQYFKGDLSLGTFPTTTSGFSNSTNKNFVTDAQLTVIGNTSGTNTGDQTTISGNAGSATILQTARNIQGVSFDGSAAINIINGTGFVKATGTTLSYDNTTYLSSITSGNVTTALGYTPLNPANNLSEVTAATARTNLGLGTLATQSGTFSGTSSGTNTGDNTFSTGLTNTSGTITDDLATGKAGGLTIKGGTASGENLTFQSTTNATRGKLYFGSAQTSYFDEANNFYNYSLAQSGAPAPGTTKGYVISNSTVSTAGQSKYSPPLELNSTYWNGSASTTQHWAAYSLGDNTLGALYIGHAKGGASSYTVDFEFDDDGGISAGTWKATKIGLVYGGTNADLSATGGAGQVLKQLTTGAAITVGTLTGAELSINDVTTNNATTSAHGFQAKGINVATEFYRSDNTQDVPLTKFRLVANAFGSVILYEPPNQELYNLTTSTALASGTMVLTPVYVEKTTTLTGVKFWQVVQGSYTADQVNGIALYSYSAGTLTQVATSANDGTIWKASANTLQTVAFTGTYSAAPGVYLIVGLYHSSAQTTAPTIAGGAAFQNAGNVSASFSNSAKLSGTFAGQTTLVTPLAMSSFSTTTSKYYFALY